MQGLDGALRENAGLALMVLALIALGLAVAIVVLGLRYRALERRWTDLLRGARGENLEELLQAQMREHRVLAERIGRCQAEIDDLGRRFPSCKRFSGLVRFDAFPDVGGEQSFALALYDERGDGFVLSSLVGREGCRVYCKPLKGGHSDRLLSDEERGAVERARAAP